MHQKGVGQRPRGACASAAGWCRGGGGEPGECRGRRGGQNGGGAGFGGMALGQFAKHPERGEGLRQVCARSKSDYTGGENPVRSKGWN
jgi:hypothetical protein